MATTFVDVSTYLVFAYGGPGGNAGAEATVSLGIPNAFAFLRFYPDSASLSANSKTTHVSGKPIYYVNYKYSQLANILDLLRNEKPVKFFFRDDNFAAYITTSDEPVGEGEA
ncbi:MAG: hypothetical protein HGB23_10045 [Chlorobiaceae bacterium]|nr:hypothetical protein [Chlorobiaceae bacterium]